MWHKGVTAVAGIPLIVTGGWLLYRFDRGQTGAIATIVFIVGLIGAFRLLRYSMIEIGNALIRFDQMMHPEGGPQVDLPLK